MANQVAELNDLLTEASLQEQIDDWLNHQSPQQIVRWAVETFGPGLVMTSSFGLKKTTG